MNNFERDEAEIKADLEKFFALYKTTPTAVYKHYDIDDNLIYVGVASDVTVRQSTHFKMSKWQQEIQNVSVEWHYSRLRAEIREILLIKAFRPKYNKVHNNDNWAEFAIANRFETFAKKLRQSLSQLCLFIDDMWDECDALREEIEQLERFSKRKRKGSVGYKKIKDEIERLTDRTYEIEWEIEMWLMDDAFDAAQIQRCLLNEDPYRYILQRFFNSYHLEIDITQSNFQTNFSNDIVESCNKEFNDCKKRFESREILYLRNRNILPVKQKHCFIPFFQTPEELIWKALDHGV
mgnify:CR=1 FL=1|tara:strand:- start:592 stop:1470 length:879 start_codon:yes stop_codon:yes gene_type:complete